MDDFYADVLDHVGRPPREFGSLHLHVEPVTRNPLGQAIAVVWLQSAFEPPATNPSSLLVMGRQKQGSAQRMLGQFPLPSLAGGRVVRWRLPLELPPEFDEVHVEVDAQLHPEAGRVRPAWKLFDTLEIPKESDMKAASGDVSMGIDLGDSLLNSVMSGGMSVTFSVGFGPRVSPGLDRMTVKRHAAATLPTAFIAAVVDGPLSPLTELQSELVWEPGMPLPAASAAPSWEIKPTPVSFASSQKTERTCFACGFEGPRAEYERATMCPRCDAAWM
ncbi:hypothetical protein [Comamonas sp. JC664]|uniref:hypothetical protein n=1 Tax=Comamonas sp. JC664 TaxID=2801917 RepID=UPI00174D5F17|nr:hypothetical protein [Comamonas sp. JC664]MBL0695506.1 hypothetical protein [Comamonas sp. JC664]GHG61903.1 hypothetical protein GCM10012319_00170 [Comamonas sp. KCTC 72670]